MIFKHENDDLISQTFTLKKPPFLIQSLAKQVQGFYQEQLFDELLQKS